VPVRLLRGYFLLLDGTVADDFESIPTGVVTSIPQVTGTAGCVLFIGTFLPRE